MYERFGLVRVKHVLNQCSTLSASRLRAEFRGFPAQLHCPSYASFPFFLLFIYVILFVNLVVVVVGGGGGVVLVVGVVVVVCVVVIVVVVAVAFAADVVVVVGGGVVVVVCVVVVVVVVVVVAVGFAADVVVVVVVEGLNGVNSEHYTATRSETESGTINLQSYLHARGLIFRRMSFVLFLSLCLPPLQCAVAMPPPTVPINSNNEPSHRRGCTFCAKKKYSFCPSTRTTSHPTVGIVLSVTKKGIPSAHQLEQRAIPP